LCTGSRVATAAATAVATAAVPVVEMAVVELAVEEMAVEMAVEEMAVEMAEAARGAAARSHYHRGDRNHRSPCHSRRKRKAWRGRLHLDTSHRWQARVQRIRRTCSDIGSSREGRVAGWAAAGWVAGWAAMEA